ncbi:Rieske 2Fe-2S domain-containing protein [Allocoleopsis sp.]|uniref:Rieske 2Fe-2S domain-containing protein n=1 Tax=Allocoleopsis sp. TaxID=3088169 RepID=UPI002FD5B14A
MKTELEKGINNDLEIKLNNGHFFVFHDFTDKQFYYDSVQQIILDGIEKIEGMGCRQAIEKTGLATLHEYFPVDKLIYLDIFIRKHIRQLLIEMAYSFCKNDLRLSTEFFLAPDTFVVKICYPFEVAIKSKVSYAQYVDYKNQQLAESQPFKLKNFLKKIKSKTKKIIKKTRSSVSYHDRYPYAANTYGPHLDSWYGAPLDGVNLWWSITSVREDNSVILYPETFGRYIQHKPEFGYIPPGSTLPKPHKVEIPDGSILVFNSDLLHGSHLNISNVTRIAIAPRISLQKPKFNPEASDRELSGWYSSEDIAKGVYGKLIKFPRKDNGGILYEGRQKPYVEKRLSMTLNYKIFAGRPIALCPSDTLSVGEKMLVNFQNESIVIFRIFKELRAVSAFCPHLNINLIDGFHDEQHIHCPGHGVAFSLADGSSKCSLLKLQVYTVYDRDNKIFIEKAGSRLDANLHKSYLTEV